MKKIYIHTENICGRRQVEIKKVAVYLQVNGHIFTNSVADCDCVVFFGCAFNQYNTNQSTKQINTYLATGKEVIVLEGIADRILAGQVLDIQQVLEPSHVIPCREFQRLDKIFKAEITYKDISEQHEYYDYPEAVNAYVIQVTQGCLDHCAYCGDKLIVKDLQSKPLQRIIAELQTGVSLGWKRFLLSGDDVGAWGMDIGGSLPQLLREVTRQANIEILMDEINIRHLISYLPELEAIFSLNKIRNMTVAVQSGSDRILALMKRKYTRDQAIELLSVLRKHGIKTRFHMMVGFPTETDEDFRQSLTLIEQGGYSSGSLFEYQEMPELVSASLLPKVTQQEVQTRMDLAAEFLHKIGFTKQDRRSDKLSVSADSCSNPGIEQKNDSPLILLQQFYTELKGQAEFDDMRYKEIVKLIKDQH